MRQTNSAINMLVHAYKAILSNCYIKEKLLGGGKSVFKSLVGVMFLGSALLGSAFASDFNNSQESLYTDDVILEETENFNNSGEIKNTNIKVTGGKFVNTGNIDTDILDVYASNSASPIFEGNINASKSFTYRGTGNDSYKVKLDATVDTPVLRIIDEKAKQTGLLVSKQATIDKVDNFYIESNGGKTGLIINGDINIKSPVELVHKTNEGQDARVEIYNNGQVHLQNLYVKSFGDSKEKVQVNGNAKAFIENITIDSDSKLNLQTNVEGGSKGDIGEVFIRNIDIGENSSIRASVYGSSEESNIGEKTQPSLKLSGEDVIINLALGASVDFGGFNKQNNQDWRPEDITIGFNTLTVNVADSSKEGGSFVYLPGTKDEQGNYKNLLTKVENIKLIAAANNNTGNAESDLTALANIIKTNTKETVDGVERVNTLRCLPGVLLEQKPTDIFDGSTAIIADSGDCENCTIKDVKIDKIQTEENPNINGIAEMAALGLHVWRNEIDDMHKRVGELRDSNGDANGMWARVNNGQARYGDQDVKNNFTSVQVGYDRQIAPGVWLGGAISYTDGDNDFRYGDGETDLYSFSLYNTWLFDNGIYLDLVGKIGRMKNSFDIQYDSVDSSGDYHTNAVSLSAEMGWRYFATESLFVEPQLEMWYGHVFDADYRTSTGIDVDNDDVNSLVGRAGIKFGVQFPDELGSFFVKASVLHDWEGDADFTFRKGDIERSLTESLGGTWYEYGLGADFNPTEKVHIYADIEAGSGGEVDTDYRFNLGARYAF